MKATRLTFAERSTVAMYNRQTYNCFYVLERCLMGYDVLQLVQMCQPNLRIKFYRILSEILVLICQVYTVPRSKTCDIRCHRGKTYRVVFCDPYLVY